VDTNQGENPRRVLKPVRLTVHSPVGRVRTRKAGGTNTCTGKAIVEGDRGQFYSFFSFFVFLPPFPSVCGWEGMMVRWRARGSKTDFPLFAVNVPGFFWGCWGGKKPYRI